MSDQHIFTDTHSHTQRLTDTETDRHTSRYQQNTTRFAVVKV